MTVKQSAGLLLFKKEVNVLKIFLVHPGGPFWKKKDAGAWSIPKGEFIKTENAQDAAKREFNEETGQKISGNFIELLPVIQKSGKKIYAWAIEYDIDATAIISNQFEIEWPPRSGKIQSFPEIDKGEWFSLDEARIKINEAQVNLLNQLAEKINA